MLSLHDGYARVISGWLAGQKLKSGVKVFKGIPYASAPTGNLRWKAPEPPAEWSGIREAYEFGPEAVQEGMLRSLGTQAVSEDCLYLNIWTPAENITDKLAVLVWIHGGSLLEGAGSNFLYEGSKLAETGIVIVTINYRLGIFGFLAHPQLTAESGDNSSGNYGLLDQLMAIKWVRENIGQFGGDPGRIALGGQSAGALCAGALLASQKAGGLFQRAILQSGPPFGLGEFYSRLAEEERTGENFFKAMGVKNIAELRLKPTAEIFKKSRDISFMARITVGGRLLADYPGRLICEGKYQKVPVLLGGVSHEFSDKYSPVEGLPENKYIDIVRKQYGSYSAKLLELYPPAGDIANARTAIRMEAHKLMTGAEIVAKAVAGDGGDAYLYYFCRAVSKEENYFYGANHSSELPFLFHLADRGNIFPWDVRSWEKADYEYSKSIMVFWSNFVRKGDPNGKNLPVWSKYGTDNPKLLAFGDEIKEIQDLESFNFAAFEDILL